MNDTRTFASAPHQAARPGTPVAPAECRVGSTAWRACEALSRPGAERIRFRWELEQKLKANPHLIDDIGLTKRQVEAEIAKPFWQA